MACISIGGCAQFPLTYNLQNCSGREIEDRCEFEELTNLSIRIGLAQNAELSKYAETLTQNYQLLPNDRNRRKLGVFFALAPAPYADRTRALQLLEPNGPAPYRQHPLIETILNLLKENKRQTDGLTQQVRKAEEAQSKLRDELTSTKEQAQRLKEELQDVQQRVREEKARADAAQQNANGLKQKLDDLLKIETNMQTRNPAKTP